MEKIGTTTIIRKSSKPNYSYPFVRFPKNCTDCIGKQATIYRTEHEGNSAFLVVLEEVVEQPSPETGIDSRISSLELEVERLSSLIRYRCGILAERIDKLERLKNTTPPRSNTSERSCW